MRRKVSGNSILAAAAIWASLSGIAAAGSIQGTATYRERIAVPPDATLIVELQDVSLADAPAVTLSAKRYALTGVPASFELTFDDALIRDGMRYAVRGAIYKDRKLLFTTDTSYPVLTNGEGNETDLILVQVQGNGAAMLENTQWSATEMNGEALDTEKRPEIQFAQGGAFGGSSGCNRFNGQAKVSGNSLDFPDNMAATLMACPPPYGELEQQFFQALQRVTSYARAGNELILTDSAGEAVLRFRVVQ
ncbi:MAG: YbaY family lipoprotein [Ruegeria sp.]